VELFTKQQLEAGKKRGKELLAKHANALVPFTFKLEEGNPAFQINQLAAKQTFINLSLAWNLPNMNHQGSIGWPSKSKNGKDTYR
jgi:hypothetical protein